MTELHSIKYLSIQPDRGIFEETLEDLRLNAVSSNRAKGISGYLYYSFPYFLQYFEGDALEVAAQWKKISNDKRHSIEKLIFYVPISKRRCESWHMLIKKGLGETAHRLEATFEVLNRQRYGS